MTARERYDAMVRRRIGSELKQHGFRRLRNRFARWTGTGWQIIDFQASDFGDRDDVRFTVNLATAVDGLRRRSAWDERRPPTESNAHLRDRLGFLVDGRDVWWTLDRSTDAETLADELLVLLLEHALPWLEARSSLEDVLQLATSRPEALGWPDLRGLPKLLEDAGHGAAAAAVEREASRRES